MNINAEDALRMTIEILHNRLSKPINADDLNVIEDAMKTNGVCHVSGRGTV